jgi:hypothetical protein
MHAPRHPAPLPFPPFFSTLPHFLFLLVQAMLQTTYLGKVQMQNDFDRAEANITPLTLTCRLLIGPLVPQKQKTRDIVWEELQKIERDIINNSANNMDTNESDPTLTRTNNTTHFLPRIHNIIFIASIGMYPTLMGGNLFKLVNDFNHKHAQTHYVQLFDDTEIRIDCSQLPFYQHVQLVSAGEVAHLAHLKLPVLPHELHTHLPGMAANDPVIYRLGGRPGNWARCTRKTEVGTEQRYCVVRAQNPFYNLHTVLKGSKPKKGSKRKQAH